MWGSIKGLIQTLLKDSGTVKNVTKLMFLVTILYCNISFKKCAQTYKNSVLYNNSFQVTVMMTFRVHAMILRATANSSNVEFLRSLSPNMFFVVNSITGLLFVPLVNHIFIPCLPCISMRGRMAVGMVINALAVLSAGCIENSIHGAVEPLHALLLYIIPIVLVTLPETLTTMSGISFI